MSAAVGERRRLAVRVTKDALRQVRAGHPWVFADSITSVSDDGAPGDLAVVFDDQRRFAAIGLWDPGSPIRIKILHTGAPRPIDVAFWRERLAAALAVRAPLAARSDTTGYRCVHGENDGLPALVLDRYASTYVVKLYSPVWVPHLDAVVTAIVEQCAPDAVVLRASRTARAALPARLTEGTALVGATPVEPVVFRELGLAFEADVVHGQKTGYFLDQRDNRALVGSCASGARVLDVFSCAGGFSVHAAAGGATLVHAIDTSAGAIAAVRRNLARNRGHPNVATCRVDTTCADAFTAMHDLACRGTRFEIVVIDPPSFAHRQASVGRALAGYRRLTALAVRLVEPGGLLVHASCSSRVTAADFVAAVLDEASRHRARLTLLECTGHPLDHPIGFAQGAYLKALVARVG
jgi:23S rRNA (cytosine1962-C5)-methyltransferase